MSGDTYHGSAVTTYTDGQAMLDPINEHIDPDVYVPGNWDYSNEAAEDGNFVELMDELDAPRPREQSLRLGDRRPTVRRLRTPRRWGVSVGVVGMTNVYVDRMAPAFYEGKYRFGKHPALLEESAHAAREDGADVVVAVTEIGLPWIVQAAKDCPSVDVMFSAHTHEYTYDPIVVKETETVVVESGMGEALGRVDLRVRDGDVQFRHHLYCLTEDSEHTPEPDADAQETVEAVREPFFADDPGSSGEPERSTVPRYDRRGDGNAALPTVIPRECLEHAVQRRTAGALRHRPRRLTRIPVRDRHPARRDHARPAVHVLP